jgi:16S rRNA (cytosine967-C5)-methyltransferase
VSGVTPARACAFATVRRVFEDGAYADRAFVPLAAGLGPRDRALAMRIAYGAVQRRATIDHVISVLARRSVDTLDPPVLAALRVGLAQILFLDGIAEYAAVGESVELVKRSGRGGGGLVNAVLRRAAREGRGLVAGLPERTAAEAALRYSVPEWIAELWFSELGSAAALALLGRVNEPAEAAVRVNTLVATADAVLSALPVAAVPAAGLPEGLVLQEPFDVHGSELFARGAVMPQARSSMAVARALAPSPGASVLDLCAAPGGKTTHLAALMDGDGSVIAVERNAGRAAALVSTCSRTAASCVSVEVGDACVPRADGPFDFVLVDPPCSGLGTLQSRPDLRWRASPESVRELATVQAAILAAGAAAVKPGGALVYSVCTISDAESGGVVDPFLERASGWTCEHRERLLPHVDGTDGFFVARLRRAG